MKRIRITLALGAFFVLAAALAGCGGGVGSDQVAVMAGNPITTRAFNHWMYVAAKSQAAQSPGQPVIVPEDPPNFTQCISNVKKQIPQLAKTANKQLKTDCSQLFTSLSSQVMDFLIKAYWYQAEAHNQNIKVSDKQVQQAFNTAKQAQFPTPAQFQTFLSQTGQTLDDILFRFRVNQIYTKLLGKHKAGAVTQAQIQQYYNTHKAQFGSPQTRDVRIVLAKTAAQANQAKQALQQGKSWSQVAKQYSSDPTTKNSGGLLKNVTQGQQDAALDKAAFAAALNQIQGPVKGQFGYYVLEVAAIHKGTQQSLAQATPQIRQTLTAQQQTSAQGAVDSKAKKDWQSKTECKTAYAMADCKGYKAPKSSAGSSSSSGSSSSQ
jgi:parvulin-like peptidyl-prolyl isomerase